MRQLLILFSLLLACVSCTHNNGDIGPLFGNWKVESIQKNGVEIADYKGNYFMGFQNHVFSIIIVNDDLHSVSESYARWEREDNTLIITFGDPNYSAPLDSYLKNGKNICTIEYLNDSRMEFSQENGENEYIYKLKKW